MNASDAGSAEWRPRATREVLQRRAELLGRTRAFFHVRNLLEVDVPILQNGANLDRGVVPFRVDTVSGPRFLPTSPEHPLKRLVSAGYGGVWALAPAFRAGEQGKRHRPEFRMLEWYRPGWDDRRLATEVIALLSELSCLPTDSESVTWREAFRRHAGIDPRHASDADLRAVLGAAANAPKDRDETLDLVLTELVEPHLGQGRWTMLVDYPVTAAAQARLRQDSEGDEVAARFEIYRNGIELANGYWELTDAAELSARLAKEHRTRSEARTIVQDRHFAAAMASGLEPCAGVAVGFDRVVALALGKDDIGDVMAFPDERA